MADQEQVERLKHSVQEWNTWRQAHPEIRPDLSNASLIGASLGGADLSSANLIDANLGGANLYGTNLSNADLIGANLNFAGLYFANLTSADLTSADLTSADLTSADLTGARVGMTIFGNLDLRTTRGLDTVKHRFPSTIGIDTIYQSQRKIPEIFLRQAGVPASFLEIMASIPNRPIEYYTCFISSAKEDHDLAERLHADLQSNGMRCWFAPHDQKRGKVYRKRPEESMGGNEKWLLILSVHSVKSDWVAADVVSAEEKGRRLGQQTLFPIRVDDAIFTAPQQWATLLRRVLHIGDFTRWREGDQYRKMFDRLLRDLQKSSAKERL
jgi:hypothetical protein